MLTASWITFGVDLLLHCFIVGHTNTLLLPADDCIVILRGIGIVLSEKNLIL
jgi:hypothetical protein